MDICHLNNAELEQKLKKCEGCVVLRGDSLEDVSGAYAVSTEQGSSASHMTAAKIRDVIAKVPDFEGQAADAVSLKSKWRMLPDCSKFPSQNVQTYGYDFQDMNDRNHGPVWKTQLFFLTKICTVILWQDCYGKGHLKKFY